MDLQRRHVDQLKEIDITHQKISETGLEQDDDTLTGVDLPEPMAIPGETSGVPPEAPSPAPNPDSPETESHSSEPLAGASTSDSMMRVHLEVSLLSESLLLLQFAEAPT